MKYLLDTHVLIWSLTDRPKLSAKVKKILIEESNLLVSVVSLWEISLKYSLGKLEMDGMTPDEFFVEAESVGFKFAPISNREAVSFHRLQRLHKDPFDRMIVWQCISNGLTLLSKDNRMQDYERLGLHLIW
jgi:PIN domain nuclease of toxin-antitoxin system